jgi:hypothetical protein
MALTLAVTSNPPRVGTREEHERESHTPDRESCCVAAPRFDLAQHDRQDWCHTQTQIHHLVGMDLGKAATVAAFEVQASVLASCCWLLVGLGWSHRAQVSNQPLYSERKTCSRHVQRPCEVAGPHDC